MEELDERQSRKFELLNFSSDDEYKYLELVKAFKNELMIKCSLKAADIQINKELNTLYNERGNRKQTYNEVQQEYVKDKLNLEKDELHLVLNKNLCLASAFQDSIINTQINQAVCEAISTDDDNVREKVLNILDWNADQLRLSSELSREMDENERLQRDVTGSRAKFQGLLTHLKEKWELFEGKTDSGKIIYGRQSADPEVKKLEEKYETRINRIQMVSFLLQNLISTCDEAWGKNQRLLEIMRLCAMVPKVISGTLDAEELLESDRELSRLIADRAKGSFVSSTPKLSKT